MYLLGYDIGSSSVKASLVDAQSGKCVASDFEPGTEAPILSVRTGWAEQAPQDWWKYLKAATRVILSASRVSPSDIKVLGISTDLEDIFIAHISGMDAMARAFESAAAVLEQSPYRKMFAERYSFFDSGKGNEYEEGKLTMEELVDYAKTHGEPVQRSGKQELYETIVNMYC